MSDVLLLGAGFSKAVCAAMPVLAELGDRLELDAHDHVVLARLGGNLERYLSYLSSEQPYLSQAENLRNRARFLEVSISLGHCLLRAQNEAIRHGLPDWLRSFVELCSAERRIVISLNYDHLIEKAAGEVVRDEAGTQAAGSDFWAVPITNVLLRSAGTLSGEALQTLTVLKLHGSLGWAYSGASNFFGETIYDLLVSRGWNEDEEDELWDRAVDKVPLIAPPTSTKNDFFQNETLRVQWRLADEALRSARSLTIIGYSFPKSDELMAGLISRTHADAKVTAVDPCELVAARVSLHLGGNVAHVGGDRPAQDYCSAVSTGRSVPGADSIWQSGERLS